MSADTESPLSFFPEKNICFDAPGTDKEAIVRHLLGLAVAELELPEDAESELLEKVLERERDGSTGVGQIAIPHVKSEVVPGTVAAMGVFPDGVDFKAVDSAPVHSVFLLISRPEQAEEHVQILRWIAGMARQRDFPRFVRQTTSAREARGLLEEMGG